MHNRSGHWKEKGYNSIFMKGVSQGWIRDVDIVNADVGINIGDCEFVTVTNVTLRTTGESNIPCHMVLT